MSKQRRIETLLPYAAVAAFALVILLLLSFRFKFEFDSIARELSGWNEGDELQTLGFAPSASPGRVTTIVVP